MFKKMRLAILFDMLLNPSFKMTECGYAFLKWLDLMFSMSLWKEFHLLQILNDLSFKYLIKLVLYESEVKFLKFKRGPV